MDQWFPALARLDSVGSRHPCGHNQQPGLGASASTQSPKSTPTVVGLGVSHHKQSSTERADKPTEVRHSESSAAKEIESLRGSSIVLSCLGTGSGEASSPALAKPDVSVESTLSTLHCSFSPACVRQGPVKAQRTHVPFWPCICSGKSPE
jgi:hypothetical protein